MGYKSKLKGITEYKKGKLPAIWEYVCHYVISCLSRRTGGMDNMGKPLLDIVWSIFIGNAMNYGNILWDDFLQYVSIGSPKEGIMEITSTKYWYMCLIDLQKDAQLKVGYNTNLFSYRDLKRFNPSKDQSLFGHIRLLLMHILESIRLTDFQVDDHIEATSGLAPYRNPSQKGSNP